MVPEALQRSFDRWQLAGRPDQIASRWNRQAWSRYFPERADLLDSIPNPVDRQAMIDRATSIDGPLTALDAFMISMIWGHGPIGYGAFRTRRVIESNGGREAFGADLKDVFDDCRDQGGLHAFKEIASRHGGGDFRYLGPAFGTKFLYACTGSDTNGFGVAPVMDAVVQRWFARHAPDRPLTVVSWHPDSYGRFLDSLKEWGDELGLAPDRVEQLIFTQGVGIGGSTTSSEEWAQDGETATAMDALAALTLTVQTLGDEAATEAADHLTALEELIARHGPS